MENFKQKLLIDIIPTIEIMVEKERLHHRYLIDRGAPIELIRKSQNSLSHLKERVKEYREYAKKLPNEQ
jgi:hypothetical protein